jgi:serine/threonine-protein kinase
MSDTHPEGRDEFDSPSFSAHIDAICDRFEVAWKAGRRPRIEDYLAEVPEPGRAALLRHLLALDVYYRQSTGETPELREYRERFPDYLAAIADAFPTVDSRAATDRPPAQADQPPPSPRALHIRCPH